ncbi:hypothetical protein RCL1_000614 [Eukaryota sp. TZLM3-RCL]
MSVVVAAAVSRRTTILTSYSADGSARYVGLMQRLLDTKIHELMSVPASSGSLNYASLFFHFLVDSDLVFMICCTETLSIRLSSSILSSIQSLFLQNCAHNIKTASSNSLDPQFKPLLKKQFVEFAKRVDTLTSTRKELDHVRNVLTDSVSKVLDRGESLSQISESASLLNHSSRSFNTRSRRTARKSSGGKCCTVFIISLIITALLVFVAMYFCGKKFECLHTFFKCDYK